jgi:hypothetical protein
MWMACGWPVDGLRIGYGARAPEKADIRMDQKERRWSCVCVRCCGPTVVTQYFVDARSSDRNGRGGGTRANQLKLLRMNFPTFSMGLFQGRNGKLPERVKILIVITSRNGLGKIRIGSVANDEAFQCRLFACVCPACALPPIQTGDIPGRCTVLVQISNLVSSKDFGVLD